MKVPLLDLKAQYAGIKSEIDDAVQAVFDTQYFILGPQVEACEKAVAAYCNTAHACGVSSGTDALLIALMNEGIGAGDEVITTPYTFFATAGSIARVGATPVFVDIDPVTFNIDTSKIEERVTDRTKAIMPVHLYGQVADMDTIMQIADSHHLAVIEDAAQAIGAEVGGQRAGSIGHYGCFSFFPSKNLGGAGDGGMVITGDPERAEKLAYMRNHGAHPKYYHKLIGGNFRLDAVQAAVVNVKLAHLDAWTEKRQANARRYDALFAEADLPDELLRTPNHPHQDVDAPSVHRHIFNQYVLRVDRRDELRAHLASKDIGSEVYYPVPLHLQDCFEYLRGKVGDHPESERAARETLALPIYPELSDAQAACVVNEISTFLR